MGALFIGFLQALFYCALIILLAFTFVWGFTWIFGKGIDPNVYKWGQICIGLLCAIILLTWLLGALGLLGGAGYPHFSWGR